MHSFAQRNNLFLALPLSLAFVDVWFRVGKGKLYLLLLSGVYLHVCHGGMKCRHCEQLPPRVFLLVAPFWQTGNGPRTIVWQNKFVKLKIITVLNI